MSAVPRYPSDIGYAGLRMTADEFLALGETPERYELIEGVVVMSPSPFFSHQRVAAQFIHQLETFRLAGGDVVAAGETDVKVSRDKVYRPDVIAYRRSRFDVVPDRLTEPPDLVVEILSGSSQGMDLLTKRDDYESFGVGEYWVIDPTDGRVRCWQRQGADLVQVSVKGDKLVCASLPRFVLDIAAVRAVTVRG